MAKKEKKIKENPILNRAGKSINLTKFNLKTEAMQMEEIENILQEIYQDNLRVSKRHVLKVLKLTWNINDNFAYLPHSLKVSKEKFELKFEVMQQRPVSIGWVIFSIWMLVFAIIGATFLGFQYLSLIDLNKDIDGDGIADINIDINNDKVPDINIDTNGDDKPDINIDYKGNRKAVFNIDTDDDNIADSNLVNDATGGKACNINCDLDGDGWPDLNMDLDGDGIPDVDIDTDGDGIADINLDLDGDGICDLMCDTDGDYICDLKCIKSPDQEEDGGPRTGSSTQTGDGNVETSTPYLVINYNQGLTVNVKGLMPDDQPEMPGYEHETPVKEFVVENMSDYPIYYGLTWKVDKNTFVSNNLKYTLTGTNGGPSFGTTTMPKRNSTITNRILIMPRVTQKFRVEINLQGTGSPQNEDQGREFTGYIEIDLNPIIGE